MSEKTSESERLRGDLAHDMRITAQRDAVDLAVQRAPSVPGSSNLRQQQAAVGSAGCWRQSLGSRPRGGSASAPARAHLA